MFLDLKAHIKSEVHQCLSFTVYSVPYVVTHKQAKERLIKPFRAAKPTFCLYYETKIWSTEVKLCT